MRYREGSPPDPTNPYTESMHASLLISVSLAFMVGLVLLVIGLKGKKLWLICWSIGLVVCSVIYFMLRLMGKA